MKNIASILICLIPIIGFCQEEQEIKNILNQHVEATRGICREVRSVRDEVRKLRKALPELELEDKETIDSIGISITTNEIDTLIARINGIVVNDESQSNDFPYWDFLIKMLAAFIGAGAALWIFFCQTKKEKEKEQAIQQKELNEKNSYLGSLILYNDQVANRQKEGILATIQKIRNSPLEFPELEIYPSRDHIRLQKTVDNPDYYHAFLNYFGDSDENIAIYRGLAGTADFLVSQYDQLYDMHEKAQRFDHDRKVTYKQILEDSQNRVDEYGRRVIEVNKPLHEFIGSVLGRYKDERQENNTIEAHHALLVIPLLEGFIGNFYQDPNIREFSRELIKANQLFNEIQAQNMYHAEKLEGVSNYFDEVVVFLEEKGSIFKDNLKKEIERQPTLATRQ